MVARVVDFVQRFPDPKNLEAIGHVVFRNSTADLTASIESLKAAAAYFKEVAAIQNYQPCSGLCSQ